MIGLVKTIVKALIALPYRVRFASMGREVRIVPPLMVEGRGAISVGDRVTIEKYVGLSVSRGGSIAVGDDTELRCFARLEAHDGSIRIGRRCGVNPFTLLSGYGGLTIGDDVRIGSHCAILTSSHRFDSGEVTIREQGVTRAQTVIEDNVWIGHGCTVVGGVRVGTGAVIGAGAVVTKDVPSRAIVVGVPARIAGERIG